MSLQPATRLGPYEILSLIGAGGMGEVYRARDTRLDRIVAVKVLPDHLSSNPQFRERFEREARAISSLSHPHICALYDLGNQDGIDYLVMEYLEGETLANRLKKGPLSPDPALQYAIQITDALDTAHKHHVIHRDLKPGNIMLTKTGAKLLDFGLAKVRAAEAVASMTALPTETTPLTGEGTILGTLQYMAPEQLEGKEADARTDIFALGAVIYEMATRLKAFEGKSQASLISAIMTAEPPAISTRQPLAPAALDHVVRTCLAKEPDARWQTAHDVLVELQWVAQAREEQAPPKQAHASPFWVAATAVFGVALAAVSFLYFRQKPPEQRPIRFSISPPEKLTFAELYEAGPALISPDGSRLAFVTGESAKHQLWVRSLNSLAAQPLAETGGFAYPFWSPDSRYLAFFADGKLKKVSADGGPAQIVCDAPNPRGGSWARASDGGPGIIVFAPDRYGALFRVSAAGGEPVQLTALDSSRQQVSHRQPEFLPDGRHFLYAATDNADKSEVFIGDLQAKPGPRNAHLLMGGVVRSSYASPGYLLFVHENSLMAQPFDVQRLELRGEPLALVDHVDAHLEFNTSNFSVSTNGVLAWRSQSGAEVRQLAWFDRTGKQLPGLDAREPYTSPSLSPDGNRIAVKRWDLHSFTGNIWLLDLVHGSASGFTFGPGNHNSAVWSPNGSWIAFGLEETLLDYRMYRKDASGAGDEQLLLKPTQPLDPTDWSRDGRFILFTQFAPNAGGDIWVLPLTGDRKPVPVLQTEFFEGQGAFSPDGRWIAYVSDESGRREVYVRSFNEAAPGATVGKWPVSTAGGGEPQWRRDGKELFYLAADGKLMAVPVKAGSTFEVRVPVALFNPGEDSQYTVSPEGGRFLISRMIERRPPGPVNICLNWLAGMKK